MSKNENKITMTFEMFEKLAYIKSEIEEIKKNIDILTGVNSDSDDTIESVSISIELTNSGEKLVLMPISVQDKAIKLLNEFLSKELELLNNKFANLELSDIKPINNKEKLDLVDSDSNKKLINCETETN